MPEIDDKQFKNEYKLLEKLKHKNVVQLVGFCNEIEKIPMMHEGKEIIAEDIHRAICLEFVPNGSLGNLLKGNTKYVILNATKSYS
jgi:coatomer subunit beta'